MYYNSEAYNSFDSVNSDHHRISTTGKVPPDFWNTLTKDQNVRNACNVKGKVDLRLFKKSESISPNTAYNNFIMAYHETAETCIPLKPKTRNRVPGNKLKLQRKEET